MINLKDVRFDNGCKILVPVSLLANGLLASGVKNISSFRGAFYGMNKLKRMLMD